MTKYALEYINEDADIELLEYDSEIGEVDTPSISLAQNPAYIEPHRTEIYFCKMESVEQLNEQLQSGWFQKQAAIDTNDDRDAYEMVNEMIDNKTIISFFQYLIEESEKAQKQS